MSMSAEQQRLLVSLVVGRNERESPNGVFVKMHLFAKKKDVYWEWELRGALANAEGTATAFDAFDKVHSIVTIKPSNASAIRLAEMDREVRPVVGHKSSPSYSSEIHEHPIALMMQGTIHRPEKHRRR